MWSTGMRPHHLREPQRSEEPLHVVERQAEERLAGGARAKLALNTSEAPALRPNGVDGFLAEVGPLRSGAAGPARSAASSFSHQHRCLRMSLNCSSRSPIRCPTRALVAPRQHAERDDAHELAAALQAVAASAPRPCIDTRARVRARTRAPFFFCKIPGVRVVSFASHTSNGSDAELAIGRCARARARRSQRRSASRHTRPSGRRPAECRGRGSEHRLSDGLGTRSSGGVQGGVRGRKPRTPQRVQR